MTDTRPKEPAPEQEMSRPQRTAFAFARQAAANVLKRRMRVLYLTRDAYAKLDGEGDAATRLRADLKLLLRLTRAWARLEYRAIPWKSILYAVAAIVYFVNPVDLIPDVLAGIGFVDDLAVITAVVKSLRTELDAFGAWEGQRQLSAGRAR